MPLNPADLTAQLAKLLASGRRLLFVQQAHRVLREVPHIPELALLTLQTLVELGFGGPARELIQIRRDLVSDDNLAKLKQAIASIPNGRVGWAERAEDFQRNVAALLAHRPQLARWTDASADALSRVHLYRSSRGEYVISRREPGMLREWMANLSTLEDDAHVKLPPRGRLGPTVVIGLRTGPVLDRIYDNTHRVLHAFGRPLYLIEPDPVRLAAWLHCDDHRKLLDDDRVYVLVGSEAVDELESLLAARPGLGLPSMFVDLCPGTGLPAQAQEVVQRVESQRVTEYDRVKRELQERYASRDAAYWAERFKPPGLVLGLTSRFTTMLQYSARDALHGLETLGFKTEILAESSDHDVLTPVEIGRRILDVDPVMVLCLDHLRYEHTILPENLPLLCWIQDPMDNLLCRRAGESIGPLDFVCGYFQRRCVEEFGYPLDRFASVPIPVSTCVFHDGEPAAEMAARYACDVSFVSNASTPIDAFYASVVSTSPAALHPILEVLYERASSIGEGSEHPNPGVRALELVRTVAAELGVTLDEREVQSLGTNFVYRLFDWGLRQETLRWVADWAGRTGRVFKIYGLGWEKHPALSQFAAGPVEHGEPLRCAYRASKLALQLIPSGFRHQRSYELLAAGALPLTRYCAEDFGGESIEECVRRRGAGEILPGTAGVFPGLERVVFRTPAEFESLAERYLDDRSYRCRVQAELREVVLKQYTYDSVVGEVMTAFGTQIARQAQRCTASMA